MDPALQIKAEIYFQFRERISKPRRLLDWLWIHNKSRDQKQDHDQRKLQPDFSSDGHINIIIAESGKNFQLYFFQKKEGSPRIPPNP
jgi:hypothetical protein